MMFGGYPQAAHGQQGGGGRQQGGGRSYGGRGGGRGRHQGRHGGRGSGRQQQQQAGGTVIEQPAIKVCDFSATNSCSRGPACTFSHCISLAGKISTGHTQRVCTAWYNEQDKSIFTGSLDGWLKKFDLVSGQPQLTEQVIPHVPILLPVNSSGVMNVQVAFDHIFLSLSELFGDDTVGIIRYVNVANLSQVSTVKLSESNPYTHTHPIKSFIITGAPPQLVLITAGYEGIIRIWQVDPTSGEFKNIQTLEGHTRGINALLLNPTNETLWSCSDDKTIKVWAAAHNWDPVTYSVWNDASHGHEGGVTCLEYIPFGIPQTPSPTTIVVPQSGLVVSGGNDNNILVWDGGFEGCKTIKAHQDKVVALKFTILADGTLPKLFICLADGSVSIRSCDNFNLLVSVKMQEGRGPLIPNLSSIVVIREHNYFALVGENESICVFQIAPQSIP